MIRKHSLFLVDTVYSSKINSNPDLPCISGYLAKYDFLNSCELQTGNCIVVNHPSVCFLLLHQSYPYSLIPIPFLNVMTTVQAEVHADT